MKRRELVFVSNVRNRADDQPKMRSPNIVMTEK